MARKYWWSPILAEQRAIMSNVRGKIGTHQAALGLTAGQVTSIQNICDSFMAAYDWTESVKETGKTVTNWRDDYFYGTGGGAVPTEPAFQAYTPPASPAEVGMVTLFKQLRDLIVEMAGFTTAIGEDLMFLGEEQSSAIPGAQKPTIQAFTAAINHHFSLVVSDRADASNWDVWILRKGGTWEKVDSCTGKSADISVSLQTAGEPEQIQVRVQLRKSNADYGQVSEPVYVTLNP